ncbi:unnamed protein product, partial [Pylaiella littoralis]
KHRRNERVSKILTSAIIGSPCFREKAAAHTGVREPHGLVFTSAHHSAYGCTVAASVEALAAAVIADAQESVFARQPERTSEIWLTRTLAEEDALSG